MDFRHDFPADTEFLKLLGRQEDQVDLTIAALELARDAYPGLPFEPTLEWIEGRAAELRGPMTRAGSDEAILGELSECLGLTVVHANRTIQELRRRGLVELENRQLTIRDRRGLEGVAEFDPSYLYLERLPY